MRVLLVPSIEPIAVTRFYPSKRRIVPPFANDALGLTAFAAKGCYDSFDPEGRSCEENQREVIASRHGSVLEHFNITFWIEGISRGLSHEFVRHRVGFAYSQRSTRYTKEEDAAIVLEPYLAGLQQREDAVPGSLTRSEIRLLSRHLASCERSLEAYREQVELLIGLNPEGLGGFALRKWARGKARNVLPHALETRITTTANLRSWRHFVETRSGRGSEPEIRRLVAAIFPLLAEIAPVHFEDYRAEIVAGFPEYTTEHPKV